MLKPAPDRTPSDTCRPDTEQIAQYRAKYGPPVLPTDLGEPEDPESFRALAAQLRDEHRPAGDRSGAA